MENGWHHQRHGTGERHRPRPFEGGYSQFTNFNGELFFSSSGLWKSDGTESGTVLIHEFSENPESLLPIGDTLFFVNNNFRPELWKTDGTITGTQLVKGGFYRDTLCLYNPICIPAHLTVVSGTLFLAADDGVNGYELWKSDGTEAGTVMVKDIVPGNVYSDLNGFLNVNGVLFFNSGYQGNMSLWKSDGTEAGTVKIKDITSILNWPILYQGKYYFTADDGVHGFELWVSDGTEAGTFMFKDLNPAGNSIPGGFTVLDGWLYFNADDGVHGRELWRTNGTPEGTFLVADIYPGASSSNPAYLNTVAGLLLFSADNGVTGAELWALNSGVGLLPVYLPILTR